jgi:cysteine desulfurase family protein (TIGR01976 family)
MYHLIPKRFPFSATNMKPQTGETISIDEVRSHFPALERVHNGHPVAYFDGPGGTQVPRAVVEAMNEYLYNHNANTHWGYPTSDETDAMIDEARLAFADFFNARPDEIVFGQNMTSLTFHLARALGRRLEPGDEIIVTELDHHGNVDTWRSLENERGIVIRTVPMNVETGQLEIDKFDQLLSKRTKLVAIGAASNALGTINDFKYFVDAARDAGALSFVDAVHYAPHNLIDVQETGCDFLACSAYKFYGPHIGILFGRLELLGELDFPKIKPAPDNSPERVETGTLSHEGIVGAAAAVDFIAGFGSGETRRERLSNAFARFGRHDAELVKILHDGLSSIGPVKLYGPGLDQKRTSLVSCTVGDHSSRTVAEALVDDGLFLSSGDFYAATVVERLGVEEQGLLRAGCAVYTTKKEVERLVGAVTKFATRFSR